MEILVPTENDPSQGTPEWKELNIPEDDEAEPEDAGHLYNGDEDN